MTARKQCPKCSSGMAAGFILDQGYGSFGVSKWQDGQPKKSIWTGVKLNKSDQVEVVTWRCERCGFLESYAPRAATDAAESAGWRRRDKGRDQEKV